MAAPSQATQPTRHELETLIIERAWKDPEFKNEFVSDPKGTIEKYSGQSMPNTVKIFVHEEDGTTMHLTIPQAPPNINELSDAELEQVAGGTDVIVTIIGIIATIVTAGVSVANDQTRARAGW
jgi:hypothetical protein